LRDHPENALSAVTESIVLVIVIPNPNHRSRSSFSFSFSRAGENEIGHDDGTDRISIPATAPVGNIQLDPWVRPGPADRMQIVIESWTPAARRATVSRVLSTFSMTRPSCNRPASP
jgi:hypothetical protein